MRRAGFTLIEIMIVVGIIVVMLATAVMSVASGRGAVQVKEATRGVIQLSRYASALALLRQRPVVVTFFKSGKVEVRISGETSESSEEGGVATGKGEPADPIYREVDGQDTFTAAQKEAEEGAEDEGDGAEPAKGSAEGGKEKNERDRLFFTRQVLDPEVLAKEDAEGEYEGVTFTVEVLGEDGEPLEPELAAMRSLNRPKREPKAVKDGEPVEGEDEASKEVDAPPVSVTYEANGNVNPHRIIVRTADASEADEGFVINISRSGKATVGDDIEEEGVRRKNGRRRRR